MVGIVFIQQNYGIEHIPETVARDTGKSSRRNPWIRRRFDSDLEEKRRRKRKQQTKERLSPAELKIENSRVYSAAGAPSTGEP
jgi:hypothetical protein